MQLVWEFLKTIWISYKFSSWHHRIITHDTRLVLHWTPSSTKCFTFHWLLPQRTPQLPFVAFKNNYSLLIDCDWVVDVEQLQMSVTRRGHWSPPQLPLVTFENLCWNWKHVVSKLGSVTGFLWPFSRCPRTKCVKFGCGYLGVLYICILEVEESWLWTKTGDQVWL